MDEVMPTTQSPGVRRSTWQRNTALRVGLNTGICVSVVLAAWLLVANRVPWSADFAGIRNLVAGGVALALALVPVARFLRSPAQLFVSGAVGWFVLTLTYLVMGLFFHRLHSRMGPLQVFMLGAIAYASIAAATWVASLVMAARQQPAVASRRRTG